MSNLKILIADDHDLVRKGLRMSIEEHPGWTVCAEARAVPAPNGSGRFWQR